MNCRLKLTQTEKLLSPALVLLLFFLVFQLILDAIARTDGGDDVIVLERQIKDCRIDNIVVKIVLLLDSLVK